MSKNEMIPATNYTALKDFNLAGAMASEMNGMDVSFDRVTIPAAGGTTFELPGELPGETDAAKEFTGVILYHHPLFAYYRERFTGGNNAPDCGSYDGVTGAGNPGGVCAQCPLNQFGSGENGGKACKNKRRIYILREGELIPILLTLPTGSMKEFAVYVKRLLANRCAGQDGSERTEPHAAVIPAERGYLQFCDRDTAAHGMRSSWSDRPSGRRRPGIRRNGKPYVRAHEALQGRHCEKEGLRRLRGRLQGLCLDKRRCRRAGIYRHKQDLFQQVRRAWLPGQECQRDVQLRQEQGLRLGRYFHAPGDSRHRAAL